MLSLPTLLPLVGDTLRAPRETFARLLALDLPRGALWQALILVVILSVLLAEGANLLISPMSGGPGHMVIASPAVFGILQLSLLVVMVFAIYWIGKAAGGQGSFAGGILLVAWLQFVMVCLQALQSVAILVMPPLAWLIGVGGLVLFLWLLTNFIAELHGFASLGRVFAMILFSMLGFALGLSFLLTLIGVSVPR
ncbi:hypothetical protein LCGC14_1420190 [marine sediment metagenome]|uniref:Yip1 domain-containing protein n=1 Tax=marine sediment metagenome TaxID=412755 RepID=A0A0F9M757_9ZZZZ